MTPPDPRQAAEVVAARLGGRIPDVAIVLGSGLGGLADRLADAVRVGYADLPGFPMPTVPGHRGELVVGTLGGRAVLAQSGRGHLYEGWPAETVALPVRVFRTLGIRVLVVTNAAGGIREGFRPGTLMLIRDHLNLTGRSPLVGRVLGGEERFPDLSAAYDAGLRALAHRAAAALDIPLEEGVYAGLLGPSYETPAEIRMLAALGADAVGMSTVVEVIAARAGGMRCLGLTTITNLAAGRSGAPLSHRDVVAAADRASDRVTRLLERIVAELDVTPPAREFDG